jgi:hypothetical protein
MRIAAGPQTVDRVLRVGRQPLLLFEGRLKLHALRAQQRANFPVHRVQIELAPSSIQRDVGAGDALLPESRRHGRRRLLLPVEAARKHRFKRKRLVREPTAQ